jgi:hypothetical protein
MLAAIYFFFNSLGLPEGLYYTTLLTPFFFVSLIRMGGLLPYSYFLFGSAIFIALQAPAGVSHWRDYMISFLLLQSVAIFIICLYYFLNMHTGQVAEKIKTTQKLLVPQIRQHFLARLFRFIAIINLILLLPALITLFIPYLRPVMWYEKSFTQGAADFPRLKMFTVEASYYSLVLLPVLAYYLLKKLLSQSSQDYDGHVRGHRLVHVPVLFFSLLLSYGLSFSLGVTGGLCMALLFLWLFNLKNLKGCVNWHFLFRCLLLFIAAIILLYYFYPDNPLFIRLQNIYTGKDTSARGRTFESFHIAWEVIQMKSVAWGLGPGQFKYVGKDFLDYYYVLSKTPAVARIPNAVAETLCIYGLTGVFIRFCLLIYFFFKTKVWTNYYRLLLFIFMFIYQFTGSYLFNPTEYVIWVLAFSPALFSQFTIKKEKSTTHPYESTIY